MSSATRASSTTIVASPLEALERDELLRTRRFVSIAVAGVALALIAVAVVPGDPLGKAIALGGGGGFFAGMAFMRYQAGDPLRFRQRRTVLGWIIPGFCINGCVVFFGVFSPAPMILVLGLYFMGLSKAGRVAVVAYAICSGLHALVATLIITGATRDLGVIHVPDLGVFELIVIAGAVQLVLITTMITARMSRVTALEAVGELEQAVRIAAHRQALLLEAREELERALRVGRGRFSDQTLGRYQLGTVLGRGAMGEVYEGTDVHSGARVAVKLLSHASLGNANLVLRFLRELRTAAGIESPHVVQVIEVGEDPVPYLVMERLDGATLSDVLREKRTLPADEAVELVAHIGIGIAAAAAAGVVHRDLKPQNVFRHRDTWKVLDFGVARGMDHGDTLTAGHIVGTPSYMAPEQASGGTVDHRTDLYALAAIAYRSLTGYPAFSAGEIAETLYRVVNTRPARPTLLAPNLHPDVDLVLAIGMAKQPESRFSTAAELARALRDALDGRLASEIRARGEALLRVAGWAESRQPRVPKPM